jgi:hypothetical protein
VEDVLSKQGARRVLFVSQPHKVFTDIPISFVICLRVFFSARRQFLIRWPMSAEGSDYKKATNGVSLPFGLPRAGLVNGS